MATGIGGLRERLTDRWWRRHLWLRERLVRLGLVATILCGLVATVVWQRLGWAYRAAPETDTLHGALVSVAILSGAGATAGAVLGFRSPGIGVALVVGVVVPVALVALLAAGVQGLQQPCGGPGDCDIDGVPAAAETVLALSVALALALPVGWFMSWGAGESIRVIRTRATR